MVIYYLTYISKFVFAFTSRKLRKILTILDFAPCAFVIETNGSPSNCKIQKEDTSPNRLANFFSLMNCSIIFTVFRISVMLSCPHNKIILMQSSYIKSSRTTLMNRTFSQKHRVMFGNNHLNLITMNYIRWYGIGGLGLGGSTSP